MANLLHLQYQERSARVALYGLTAARPRPRLSTRTAAGPLASYRCFSGVRAAAAELGVAALSAADPEIDLELAGLAVSSDDLSPAWFDASAAEPRAIGDFEDLDLIVDEQGVEKQRRPHLVRRPNIDDVHPVRLGRRLPLIEALGSIVVKRVLQLAHTDGLSFEFLREIAAELMASGSLAVLGAGAKGNQPLVLREHGKAYRALLAGEVNEGGYQLLLLLSDQELKRVAETKP